MKKPCYIVVAFNLTEVTTDRDRAFRIGNQFLIDRLFMPSACKRVDSDKGCKLVIVFEAWSTGDNELTIYSKPLEHSYTVYTRTLN